MFPLTFEVNTVYLKEITTELRNSDEVKTPHTNTSALEVSIEACRPLDSIGNKSFKLSHKQNSRLGNIYNHPSRWKIAREVWITWLNAIVRIEIVVIYFMCFPWSAQILRITNENDFGDTLQESPGWVWQWNSAVISEHLVTKLN